MVANKTPLRLVAIEEAPPVDEEQEATPVRVIAEHEAITRRVEAAATIAAHDVALDVAPKRRLPSWQSLLPAGAAAGVLVAVAVGLLSKEKPKPAAAPPSLGPTVTRPSKATEAAPVAAPTPSAPVAPAAAKLPSETIKLVVTAEPVEAELSLDGNMLAGHRLNLEVPKDRGIHVVSASAPGYLPFNQQVSFSSDVVLTISLRRSRAPAPARAVARQARSVPEARVKPPLSRPPAAEARPALEPGMNLESPTTRGNAKPIDERNPYAP